MQDVPHAVYSLHVTTAFFAFKEEQVGSMAVSFYYHVIYDPNQRPKGAFVNLRPKPWSRQPAAK